MWLAGLFTYTTVGIDHETVEGERLFEENYRLRWPGDGSAPARDCHSARCSPPQDFWAGS